ncbi:hypothetical protein [Vreelandella sulfidaeris]
MDNPSWGALAGFTKQPVIPTTAAPSFASIDKKAARSSDAERRLELAKQLKHDSAGYIKAVELRCWLSKSKSGGAMLVEEMDSVYILNVMKMIADGRHSFVKPNIQLGVMWASVFTSEIAIRKEAENNNDN